MKYARKSIGSTQSAFGTDVQREEKERLAKKQ